MSKVKCLESAESMDLPNDLHFPIAISDKELSADNVRKSVRSKLDGFTPGLRRNDPENLIDVGSVIPQLPAEHEIPSCTR